MSQPTIRSVRDGWLGRPVHMCAVGQSPFSHFYHAARSQARTGLPARRDGARKASGHGNGASTVSPSSLPSFVRTRGHVSGPFIAGLLRCLPRSSALWNLTSFQNLCLNSGSFHNLCLYFKVFACITNLASTHESLPLYLPLFAGTCSGMSQEAYFSKALELYQKYANRWAHLEQFIFPCPFEQYT